MNKAIELYFYFTVAALPIIFMQKAEDAYYIPQLCVLAPSLIFGFMYLLKIREVKKGPAETGALLFLVFLFPSVFVGPDRAQAIMIYAEWAAVLGLYFYAANFLSARQRKKTILLMLVSSAIAALYALAQANGIDLPGWATNYGGRAFSTFGNPDFFGGFIILVIPLAAGYAFLSGKKKAGILFAALFIAALLASRTRSSLAAFVLSALLALWLFRKEIFSDKKSTAAVAVMGAAVLMAVLFNAPVRERFVSALDFKNADLQGRAAMWKAGAKMVIDRPLVGASATGVKALFPKYNAGNAYFETDRLHNDFIDLAASCGLFALGAFLFLLYGIWPRGGTHMARAAAAAMAAMLLHALLNFPFFIIPSQAYFFLIAGLAAAGSGLGSQSATAAGKFTAWPAFAAGALLCAALVPLAGSAYLNSSINALNSGDMRSSGIALQHALEKYPFSKKHYFAADYYLSAGDFENARRQNSLFRGQYPYSKNGALQAGIIAGEAGEMNGAYAAFDGFLKLYPDDLHALNNRAKAAYMLGDRAAAIKDYEKVISLDPSDTVARGNLEAIKNSPKSQVRSPK